MRAKLFVNGFLLYWIFAIVGSNLHIGLSAFSYGNISLIIISSLILFDRYFMSMSARQKLLFMPLFLFIIVITIYFITAFDHMSIKLFSKYFYLTSLPILYVIIMKLGNKYGNYFFRKIYFNLMLILFLLFVVVLIELVFQIHMPTHGEEGSFFRVPTAFFGNSNGLGIITVILFILFVAFNEKYGTKKQYYLFIAIVFFIVIISFSRMAVVAMFVFFPLYFLVVRRKAIRYVFIIILIAGSLTYALSAIVDTYVANRDMNLTGWINNRLLSITDKDTYDANATSSFAVRSSIYSYPFANPIKFIVGYGLDGDKVVLEKTVRWSGITNAHSFFIESIYDFGWIGFGFIVMFFINILIFLRKNRYDMDFRFGLIMTGLFMVLVNVSSSIIGSPHIWIPLFIYLAFLTRKQLNPKIIISSPKKNI